MVEVCIQRTTDTTNPSALPYRGVPTKVEPNVFKGVVNQASLSAESRNVVRGRVFQLIMGVHLAFALFPSVATDCLAAKGGLVEDQEVGNGK